MNTQKLLSTRELKILFGYVISALIVIILFLLITFIRDRLLIQVLAKTEQPHIAVLVHTKGDQGEMGLAIASLVQWVVEQSPQEISKPDSTVKVVYYNTGDTLGGAASAAIRAAKDPATVAIIGPLDARQTLAAAEAIRGEQVAIITSSSTTPELIVGQTTGIFRVPSTDDQQVDAIVYFIREELDLANNKVFVIAEPSAYVNTLVSIFNRVSKDQLQVTGTYDLSQGPIPPDLAERISTSETEAVVYLGNINNAIIALQAITDANLDLPFIASDALNDPALLPLPENSTSVYFTSPIINLDAFFAAEGSDQLNSLPDLASTPFGCETIQAAWLVLDALSHQRPDQSWREAVWSNLQNASVTGFNGEIDFANGQLQPEVIYIYQVGDTWATNQLVDIVEVR